MSDVGITEEILNYLLKTSPTLHFIDEKKTLDKFKCINCRHVKIQNMVANCKHVFCSDCITYLLNKLCPECKNVEITEMTKDQHFEKGLFNLNVECPNKRNGCQEGIPLCGYKTHENKCKFSTKALLPKVYRRHKTDERLIEMEITINKIYVKLKEEHFNQKQATSQLDAIKEKVETMELEIKKMILESKQQIKNEIEARENFEKTIVEKMNKNTNILINLLTGTTACNLPDINYNVDHSSQLSQMKGTGQRDVSFDEDDPNSLIFNWKINEFKQHYDSFKLSPVQNHVIDSETFCNEELGIEIELRLYFDFQSVRIYSHSYKLRNCCYHVREFTLIDQSDRANKKHVSIIDTPNFGKDPTEIIRKACFLNRTLAHITLLDKKYHTYVKDDSILIQLRLIPLSTVYKTVASTDGTLVWRIGNYSVKKQDEVNGYNQFLLSPSFYTAPQGYRLHSQIYLDGNGDSKGKHISIYIYFAMGEHDHLLSTPGNGTIKFYLLDQSESTDKQDVCVEHPFQFHDGQLHGMPNFVLQSKAEEAKYLEDDAILLKIEVEIKSVTD